MKTKGFNWLRFAFVAIRVAGKVVDYIKSKKSDGSTENKQE